MIKTTRLRNSQVPQNKVYDLSPQCNGVRQTFNLPSRVVPSDKYYLIYNGDTIRNDRNHTFYTVDSTGTKLTTYFHDAPDGTAVLQFVKSDNSEGVEPFATEEYANQVANEAKTDAIAAAKDYTDDEIASEDETIRGLINGEKEAREGADEDLDDRIDDEIEAREEADTDLQEQLDAIVAKSDVVDIVGTKADLDSYDTSDLGDKDVIKVTADETHNNAISYYRFVKSTTSWNYIGSEGPYLTTSSAASTYVPQTRTINNKALNSNISLTASDVGAAAPGDIPTKTSDLTNDGADSSSTYVEADDLATTLAGYLTTSDASNIYATKQDLEDLVGDIGDILDAVHGGNIVVIEPEEEPEEEEGE